MDSSNSSMAKDHEKEFYKQKKLKKGWLPKKEIQEGLLQLLPKRKYILNIIETLLHTDDLKRYSMGRTTSKDSLLKEDLRKFRKRSSMDRRPLKDLQTEALQRVLYKQKTSTNLCEIEEFGKAFYSQRPIESLSKRKSRKNVTIGLQVVEKVSCRYNIHKRLPKTENLQKILQCRKKT